MVRVAKEKQPKVIIAENVKGLLTLHGGSIIAKIIKAFEDAGAKFYNEMILVSMLGTVPQRAAKGFETSRKVGKTHQNVLLFCKGDAKKATMNIGPVEFGDMEAGE